MGWGTRANPWGFFPWGGADDGGINIVDDPAFRQRLKDIDDKVESTLGGLKRFAEAEIIINYKTRVE